MALPDGAEYDGNGVGGSVAEFFFYGNDADVLLAALIAMPLPSGTQVIKRYGSPGDPNARTEELLL